MATEIKHDQYGTPMQNVTPRGVALARWVSSNIDSSTYHVLNEDTTYLRVYAIDKDIYLKWAEDGEDYCKSDNFDEVIPAGQMVDLAVPLRSNGELYPAIQVVGRENGATIVLIEK